MEQIIPMMSCYSTYVRDHVHAIEIFFDISRDINFKQFLEHLHSKPATKGLTVTELLAAPLHKVNVCIIRVTLHCYTHVGQHIATTEL